MENYERTSNTFFPHEFVRFPFISYKHTAVLPLQIENPVKVCSKQKTKIIPEVVRFSEIHPVSHQRNSRSPLRMNVRIGSLYLYRTGNSIGAFIRQSWSTPRVHVKTSKNNTFYPGSPRLMPVPLSRRFPPPFVPCFVPLCSLLAACRRKRRD